MSSLVALAAAGPLLAAAGLILAALIGRPSERAITATATAGLALGLVGALAAVVAAAAGVTALPGPTWLAAADGRWRIGLDLALTPPTALFALATTALTAFTLRFSAHYLHRDPGLARFAALACALAGGLALVALAAAPALMLVGWELAGVSSVLLIAYFPGRRGALAGGVRALVTNKLGDAAFFAAVALGLLGAEPAAIAALLAVAAVAKAGLVPFTPWVERAVEGPTPSSALYYGAAMTHAGLLLAARAHPQLGDAALATLAGLGLLTAVYGALAGRAQPDVKSRQVLFGAAHLGLAFALLALAGPAWALGYGLVHMLARYGALLLAPAALQARRLRPLPRRAAPEALRLAARDRFGLEARHHQLVERPITALARTVAVADHALDELTTAHPPRLAPGVTEGPPARGRLRAWAAATARIIEALEHHALGGRILAAASLDAHPRRHRLATRVEAALAHPATQLALLAALLLALWRR